MVRLVYNPLSYARLWITLAFIILTLREGRVFHITAYWNNQMLGFISFPGGIWICWRYSVHPRSGAATFNAGCLLWSEVRLSFRAFVFSWYILFFISCRRFIWDSSSFATSLDSIFLCGGSALLHVALSILLQSTSESSSGLLTVASFLSLFGDENINFFRAWLSVRTYSPSSHHAYHIYNTFTFSIITIARLNLYI